MFNIIDYMFIQYLIICLIYKINMDEINKNIICREMFEKVRIKMNSKDQSKSNSNKISNHFKFIFFTLP